MADCACNLSTWEAEAGEPLVQIQLELHVSIKTVSKPKLKLKKKPSLLFSNSSTY